MIMELDTKIQNEGSNDDDTAAAHTQPWGGAAVLILKHKLTNVR